MPVKIANFLSERDKKKVSVDVGALYHLEKSALERYLVLSAVFSTVCANSDENIVSQTFENIVFRPGEHTTVGPDVKITVRDFAHSLRAYTTEDASSESDLVVRESWAVIEKTLRSFGRAI